MRTACFHALRGEFSKTNSLNRSLQVFYIPGTKALTLRWVSINSPQQHAVPDANCRRPNEVVWLLYITAPWTHTKRRFQEGYLSYLLNKEANVDQNKAGGLLPP